MENLYAILEKYGPSEVGVPVFGSPRQRPWEAYATLEIAWKRDALTADPWELRTWQMAQVRKCIAELHTAGWYLQGHLDINFRAIVKSGSFTLAGECVIAPEQGGVGCTARFTIHGFPPK